MRPKILLTMVVAGCVLSHSAEAQLAIAPPSTLNIKMPEAMFSVKLLNEDSTPFSGGKVIAGFNVTRSYWHEGSKDRVEEGLTDADGNYTFRGKTIGEWGCAFDQPGYYRSVSGSIAATAKADGRWKPWNPVYTLIAKPILNPIPMVARKVDAVQIPVVGQPVGFDLMASDWVTPHGKGSVSDLIFTLQKSFVDVEKPFEASLTITFANEDDGIQPTIAAPRVGSELRLPRFAPEVGYEPKLVKSTSRAAVNQMIVPANKEDLNYFFRVRTVQKDKKIVSTNYGKIDRDIDFDIINSDTALLFFTYYLNPTPNDRNMEFDPKRNLLKGLKDGETVTKP
jgi:hypothetical protein